MTRSRPRSRRAGALIPLFSFPSSRSWGIGEIGDIETMVRWFNAGGLRILQLLPINEMPPGETSPYSALSAMAIDPQFITLDDVEDFAEIGGEPALEPDLRARLDAVRVAPRIAYVEVRALKNTVLRRCFARFQRVDLASRTRRAAAFQAVPSTACGARRARLVGLAGAAPLPPHGCARARTGRARERDRLPSVPAVARR
jgi:4-alpha-glucanotransferase